MLEGLVRIVTSLVCWTSEEFWCIVFFMINVFKSSPPLQKKKKKVATVQHFRRSGRLDTQDQLLNSPLVISTSGE